MKAFATILEELKKASEQIQSKNEKAKKKFNDRIKENEETFKQIENELALQFAKKNMKYEPFEYEIDFQIE